MPATSTRKRSTVSVYQGAFAETVRITTLPLSLILIPEFQRERKQAQVERIAGEYDATAYIFPIVALYGEHYIDLDGQQRLAACEAQGLGDVTVLLIEGVATKERLAELFLRFNRDRKLLSAFEKFIGALESKDPGSVAIDTLLRTYCKTMGKAATASGHLPAGAVVTIYERGGEQLLERVLLVRELAWGDAPSREAHEGRTLLGLATFIGRYFDRIEDDHLVETLRKVHPAYILTRTQQEQTVTYADFLRELYNKGRRGRAKL